LLLLFNLVSNFEWVLKLETFFSSSTCIVAHYDNYFFLLLMCVMYLWRTDIDTPAQYWHVDTVDTLRKQKRLNIAMCRTMLDIHSSVLNFIHLYQFGRIFLLGRMVKINKLEVRTLAPKPRHLLMQQMGES
jgi:hypothetical protein